MNKIQRSEEVFVDNFMDKLAKRFNAGEMIKANAQAEARDMKRLQERTAEYENMMREMRRLNLKNVEVTEQVQQLIQCGIEQFEGYGNADGELLQKLEELHKDVTAAKIGILDNEAELERMAADMQEVINGMNLTVGTIHSKVSVIGSGINTMQYQLGGIDNGIHALEQNIQESLNKGIDAEALVPVMDSIGNLQQALVSASNLISEGNKKLEDHVHRENVRVYRNVQASLIDEAGKKAREVNTRMDQIESLVKKNSGIKAMVVITMLASLAAVTLQVLSVIGML